MSDSTGGLLAVVDAVVDAERAFRHVAATVDELSDVAASSLRVLDDAATDAFYARQEDRRELHVEAAVEHLGRLRSRCGALTEISSDLNRHLLDASNAIDRASHELNHQSATQEYEIGSTALRTQLDVLEELVKLARPLVDQITHHAVKAAEAANATDALMLLDTRIHEANRSVGRADQSVAMMRTVLELTEPRVRTSTRLAGALSHAVVHPSGRSQDTSTLSLMSDAPQQTHQPDRRPDQPPDRDIAP